MRGWGYADVSCYNGKDKQKILLYSKRTIFSIIWQTIKWRLTFKNRIYTYVHTHTHIYN